MSEESADGMPVATTDAPVAIDPALLNKPIRPVGAPANDPTDSAGEDLLKHKLGLANQHAKQAKKEADESRAQVAQLQQELEQVKNVQKAAVHKSMEEQGDFKRLWEEAKKTNSANEQQIVELQARNESVVREREQEQLRAMALQRISQAGALNAQQMYVLMQSGLRVSDDGEPVMLDGGVEQPLDHYLTNLKNSEQWQHHFGASGTRGMGTSDATVAPGRPNPFRDGNLTEAMQLQKENPELAQALKTEAQR